MAVVFIALALLMVSVRSENSTASDTCEAFGPWSQALEDWATAPLSDRHGTFCSFIHTQMYAFMECKGHIKFSKVFNLYKRYRFAQRNSVDLKVVTKVFLK